MQQYHAPLYGRFTARLPVEPLPFSALAEFLPDYDLAQRVAVYAILGGIPAYLERFDSRKTIATNVQEILLDTGMFRVEPFYLLNDEVREPRNYMAFLRAIGQGNHTLDARFQTKQHASTYLSHLQNLYLIFCETPATVPDERRTTQVLCSWHYTAARPCCLLSTAVASATGVTCADCDALISTSWSEGRSTLMTVGSK